MQHSAPGVCGGTAGTLGGAPTGQDSSPPRHSRLRSRMSRFRAAVDMAAPPAHAPVQCSAPSPAFPGVQVSKFRQARWAGSSSWAACRSAWCSPNKRDNEQSLIKLAV